MTFASELSLDPSSVHVSPSPFHGFTIDVAIYSAYLGEAARITAALEPKFESAVALACFLGRANVSVLTVISAPNQFEFSPPHAPPEPPALPHPVVPPPIPTLPAPQPPPLPPAPHQHPIRAAMWKLFLRHSRGNWINSSSKKFEPKMDGSYRTLCGTS